MDDDAMETLTGVRSAVKCGDECSSSSARSSNDGMMMTMMSCRRFNYKSSSSVCEMFQTPPMYYAAIPGCTHYQVRYTRDSNMYVRYFSFQSPWAARKTLKHTETNSTEKKTVAKKHNTIYIAYFLTIGSILLPVLIVRPFFQVNWYFCFL